MIEQSSITNTVIYHVGDIGIGFTTYGHQMELLSIYNEKFKSFGITFYGIRGNHDNPHFFDGSIDMSNLKLLPDYTFLNIEGKGILGVGGAISIDRKPRIRENAINIKNGSDKRSWWPKEKFILDEDKLKSFESNTIDIVVTHTSPHFCYPRNDNGFHPIVKQFSVNDSELETELLIERGKMTQMYEILNKNHTIEKWFYGHFHKYEVTLNSNTQFICLEINQLYELIDYGDYEKEMNEKYGE